ncbi:MAG: hypothetical protein JW927_07835 [Deltaproteobacteria bacterium]|nr:hypothetical protein [Deltaproteobacteria bacterium]
MAINRTVIEPVVPSIGNTLVVSLTTLPDSAHKELDKKEVSIMSASNPPAQKSQISSGPNSVPGPMAESEIVVTSQLPDIRASNAPEGNLNVNDITLSFNRESFYGMKWNFSIKPGLKVDGIETSIGQGVQGSETSEGNSLSTYLTPSYGLDAANRFEQVFGEMAESEFQRKNIKWRIDYVKKYEALMPPDCNTAYTNKGLLAIPYLIRDAITGNNCKW